MTTFLYANNAVSTLASNLPESGAGSTTVYLATGSGAAFPLPAAGLNEVFALTLTNSTGTTSEICWCTARSGDTLTVLRGQEGTSPLAWTAGSVAANFLTAAAQASLVQAPYAQQQPGNSAADDGSVNTLVVTLAPAPTAYAQLLYAPVRVAVSHTNTGATTINVNGLGSVAVQWHGSATPAGSLVAGQVYELVYDGSAFEMLTAPGWLGGGAQNYAVDSGTTNALAVTLSPAPVSYSPGLVVEVKVANANTGAATINVNGLGAKAITFANAPLHAGMLAASVVYALTYDGTQFQLTSPPGVLSAGGPLLFPSFSATADTIGSQGYTWMADGTLVQWATIQLEDYNDNTTVNAWVFPVAFPSGATPRPSAIVNCAYVAGQDNTYAARGTASLAAISSTGASYALRGTAQTGTLCAVYIEVTGR